MNRSTIDKRVRRWSSDSNPGASGIPGAVQSHGHAWVLGLAFQHDALTASAALGVGHSYNVPAAFAQDEFAPTPWLKIAGSARLDVHNSYGSFLNPRFSALIHRPQSPWSLRASVGRGFAAPTPWVDEIEATGLRVLLPLRGLRAERAVTESIDAKWSGDGWDVNVSVLNSEIRDSLSAQSAPGQKFVLVNDPGPRRAPGAETLVHYVMGSLQVIGS